MTPQPTPRLTLHHALEDDVLVLTLRGELDLDAEREARTWFEEQIEAHADQAGRAVVLDLRDVTFIDTSGLRALINADALARRGGWDLRITVASGPVLDTLTTSNLHLMLPLYVGSEAEAA